jgi:hypothetical protein
MKDFIPEDINTVVIDPRSEFVKRNRLSIINV